MRWEDGGTRIPACPATLIPPWLAYLTPGIDDSGTEEKWAAMVRRYAKVVRAAADRLDESGWRRVLARTMLAVIEGVPDSGPITALWNRTLAGDAPPDEEWWDAEALLWDAVRPPCSRTSLTAAASAGMRGMTTSPVIAVENMAVTAELDGDGYARMEAWDRITDVLLTAIETECAALSEEK